MRMHVKRLWKSQTSEYRCALRILRSTTQRKKREEKERRISYRRIHGGLLQSTHCKFHNTNHNTLRVIGEFRDLSQIYITENPCHFQAVLWKSESNQNFPKSIHIQSQKASSLCCALKGHKGMLVELVLVLI